MGDRFNQGTTAPAAGTFRLPNMQARTMVGVNVGSSIGMGSFWSGGVVGEADGSYDPVMPYHNHSGVDHLHSLNLNTGGQSANHVHLDDGVGAYAMAGNGAYGIPLHYLPVGVGTDIGGPYWFHFAPNTGANNVDHVHLVNGWTGAADRSLSTGFAGGGNQIQPGIAVNYLIRVV